MAGSSTRCSVQVALKAFNYVIGLAGMAMILYALWMLRAWLKHIADASLPNPPLPWFISTFMVFGVLFCLLTCSGHIAAETASGHCLSCYTVFVFLLVVAEGAVAADILLNRYWEQDFPADPTGKFDEFKNFVRANFDICKWVGLSILGAQVFTVFLAMVLRALGPDRGGDYDSDDDDFVPARLPLLRSQSPNAHASPFIESLSSLRSNSWRVKIHD